MNNIQENRKLGQSIWLDYIRRGFIDSGELTRLIDLGITGLTANPTIMEKAIIGSSDYDNEILSLARTGKSNEQIYEIMAIEDIRRAADLLLPVYRETKGEDGYPSLEITPLVAYDTGATLVEARRLFRSIDRPNVMVKVPATPQGIPAIRQLVSEGINVNVTLIFSPEVYEQVKDAYIRGLEAWVEKGGNPVEVTSVASFFLSRIDTMVDNLLVERIKKGDESLKKLAGQAAIASARIAYASFNETFNRRGFSIFRAKGAHVQRLLWASTGAKNPNYGDVKYVDPLIGPETINTMTLSTFNAFLDHGKPEVTIKEGLKEARQVYTVLAEAGIDMKIVGDKLLTDGVKLFNDSYAKLITGIGEKRTKLTTGANQKIKADYFAFSQEIKKTVRNLEVNDIVRRIWRADYTIWGKEPKEIADRLGWLSVTEIMIEQVPAIKKFAEEIREAGFSHVVLLGMGGSSLGAEVLNRTFGSAPGFPKLIILDSTLPEAVRTIAETINPVKTLFIVSSKSGTTREPMFLYRYFKQLMEKVARIDVNRHFIAITDPGTPLHELSQKENFRRVFLNPTNIGGRYSVLSYFGLIPAALIGVDIKSILESADTMREACASCVPVDHNPGCQTAAFMSSLALNGIDKLTILTSPSLTSFGLWLEQLIAESTGKGGKGIIPIAGEPVLAPDYYGKDRMFVYLRLKDDNNSATDAAANAFKDSGFPVEIIELKANLDLGSEFFRWQFATAISGYLLGINPFDQPDVQSAKIAMEDVLREYKELKHCPGIVTSGSFNDLINAPVNGKYFAIMAYLEQSPETDGFFFDLRKQIMERYHIATTLGYGPRFLHSTGQLHKGGPNSGLFLQISSEHEKDIEISDESYSFGLASDAQAIGDLRSLHSTGRKVVTVRLPRSDISTLKEYVGGISKIRV